MVTNIVALGAAFDAAPDDTEETLVGSSHHQGAIRASGTGLTILARRRRWPWLVGDQLTVVMPRHGGRPPYQPVPDLLVHTTVGPAPRQSLNIAQDGSPALVIEVASPATARERDLSDDPGRGKPHLYAAMGIPEYLVFDPLAEFIREQVRAWRLGPRGGYEPWLPDARGHWVSQELGGVSFAPQGFLLRVYDEFGELLPIVEELDDENQRLTARLAALEAELRRLRGE